MTNKWFISRIFRCKLKNEMNYYLEGAALHSKILWYQQGNKTQFFYVLEKLNFNNKMMKIKPSDGQIITNSIEILKEQKKFCEKL